MYKLYAFFDLNSVVPSFFDKAIAVLPAERAERIERYKKTDDKYLSAISYLLCIYGINDCFSIFNPTVEIGKNGKPFLPNHPNIHFNISHCKSGCVCAVSSSPVGIDIQDMYEFSFDVANRICGQNELSYISKAQNKSAAFTKIWAMKESYVKMTGEGICCDLKKIDVTQMYDIIKVIVRNDYVIAICVSSD